VSEFLGKYLEYGLTKIAVIDYDHSESASGHVETTDETVGAKKGNRFVKAHLHEYLQFLKGPSDPPSITQEEITESEYLRLSTGKKIADTPETLAGLQEDRDRSARHQQLHDEFMKTAPPCPKCGGRMADRKGPRGQFWGCGKFPQCKGTANFSQESRKRYQAYYGSL
jgi:hypothetical protein